jgi:hypothetical protein
MRRKMCEGPLPLPLWIAIIVAAIFVLHMLFQYSLDKDDLVDCRREAAQVEEHNSNKASDITARRVSEHCEALLQNCQ